MMKHLLLLVAILMMVSCGSSNKKGEANVEDSTSIGHKSDGESVYVCTGGSSKRYHSDKDCKGLSRCSGEIEEISEEEAEDMGRTPCHLCY